MSREQFLPLMADYVLCHGLAGASLRPLARAAGTSDRMLIYHFGNKEALLVDLLAFIARQYSQIPGSGLSDPAQSRREVLGRVLALADDPLAAPYQLLWWDIVAGSARDLPGYRDAAKAVMAHLLEWLEAQMPRDDPDPPGGARLLLTLIEGAHMLRAVGQGAIAEAGLALADL